MNGSRYNLHLILSIFDNLTNKWMIREPILFVKFLISSLCWIYTFCDRGVFWILFCRCSLKTGSQMRTRWYFFMYYKRVCFKFILTVICFVLSTFIHILFHSVCKLNSEKAECLWLRLPLFYNVIFFLIEETALRDLPELNYNIDDKFRALFCQR